MAFRSLCPRRCTAGGVHQRARREGALAPSDASRSERLLEARALPAPDLCQHIPEGREAAAYRLKMLRRACCCCCCCCSLLALLLLALSAHLRSMLLASLSFAGLLLLLLFDAGI